MAGHRPPAITPADPYTWRESVLSTRTLSYISQADALGSPGYPPNSPFHTHSRNNSTAHAFRTPTRQSTMDEESEYGLEMARTRRLEGIRELPDSVARSRLFSLPREIRDRIYLFCLTARDGECVEWPNTPDAKPQHMAPQLLRTCKLVYAESVSVLYTSNRISFAHPSDANMFVRAIASPIGTVTFLNLHVKAQDSKSLWTAYLTSTDRTRSLKADFPSLKELVVRFKSNKWQHALPVEGNLRHAIDDLRLEEIIKGLGHVFYPVATPELPASNPVTQEEFQEYLEENPDVLAQEGNFKQRLLHLHRAQQAFAATRQPPSPPIIRIICACRIHHTHFAALTSTTPIPPHQAPVNPAQGGHGAQGVAGPPATAANMIPGMATLQGIFAAAPPPAPQPVQPEEEYRGFSPIDFRGRVKTVVDFSHEGVEAVARVARTVFAKKGKIGLAMEIFSVETTAAR